MAALLAQMAALAAPRALMVLQCKRDKLFPPAGMAAAVETIAAAYHDVVDGFAGFIGPSATSRRWRMVEFYTPAVGGASPARANPS